VDRATRGQSFRQAAANYIASIHILPFVVADMNCMQEDTEANFRTKRCKALADFMQVFHLVDCFRQWAREYTSHKPGVVASRLDQVYAPPDSISLMLEAEHVDHITEHAAILASYSGQLCMAVHLLLKCQSGHNSFFLVGIGGKPFFRKFCQHFTKRRTHRLRETRYFLQEDLMVALEGGFTQGQGIEG
jgi:hypothetical protein